MRGLRQVTLYLVFLLSISLKFTFFVNVDQLLFYSSNYYCIYHLVHCHVLETPLGDKVCQILPPINPACHDITEILLKVVLNTITLTPSIT
jgi:hypothetical protein